MKNIKDYFNNLDDIDNVIDMVEEWEHGEGLGPKEIEWDEGTKNYETGMNDNRFKEFKGLLLSRREELIKFHKEIKLKVNITLKSPVDDTYYFEDEEANYEQLHEIIKNEIESNLLMSNSSILNINIEGVKNEKIKWSFK